MKSHYAKSNMVWILVIALLLPSSRVLAESTTGGGSSWDADSWGGQAYVPLLGDVNGDGKADRVVYRSSDGDWGCWITDGGRCSWDAHDFGGPGYVPLLGDVNGDGKADRVVYRSSDGDWGCWITDGGRCRWDAIDFGGPAYVPLLGDVNGDGKVERVVYRFSDGDWGCRNADGGTCSWDTHDWGGPAYVPLLGDVNRDGKADRVVYRSSDGDWGCWITDGGRCSWDAHDFGGPAYVPLLGDVNGDGKVERVVYRSSDGDWGCRNAEGGTCRWDTHDFGEPAYVPLLGDVNGDGQLDRVVYRSSDGNWSNRTSTRQVCLYEHKNYRGWQKCFKTNQPNFVNLGINDTVSSLKVAPGCTAELYQHINYRGFKRVYTGDNAWVGNANNDEFSSLKVLCVSEKLNCAKLQEAIVKYAPRIQMAIDEEWFPSSIAFFNSIASRRGRYFQANDSLDSPSDWKWDGAFGQDPTVHSVPIYAFVVEGKKENSECATGLNETFTDIFYFAFFPYNRGKRVCTGVYHDNYCPVYIPFTSHCAVPRINGCVGGYTVFGNHVGDWEHVTVRLRGNLQVGCYTPVFAVGSTHDSAVRLPWSSVEKTADGHPIIFAAKGSHGMYFNAARHRYQNLPNGHYLVDETSKGKAWDTWKNVVTVTGTTNHWTCSSDAPNFNQGLCSTLLSLNNFRWGNKKDGCGIIEALSGECRLNDGPAGPNDKGFVTNPNTCE